ncbi:MAG: TonB-dependent receptor [Fermentimonas sp.]|nr:TonB-dependent receptor [Fermentimonas sp.]
MRRIAVLFIFCLSVLTPLLSNNTFFIAIEESGGLNDTVRLDEVIVTGTMPKVNLRNVPMSISVVSGNKITDRMQPSLLPLLTEEVPGLFISQRGVMGYGVAAGAAGGMNIRGIGGSPTSGVLVLIDGHPQYMGLMGHPLADSYQSMMTERVEVVRGPASVLYGSNAMGGVINIITRKQESDGSHKSAQISYGSYNTLNAEVSGGMRKNQFYTNGSIGYSHSDGHRVNMDFEQFTGYAKAGYDFTGSWSSFIDLNLSKTLSSNPGPLPNPIIDNDADILRGVASASLENDFAYTSGAVKLFYNFGTHKINDGYQAFITPTQPGVPPEHRFRSNDQMFGVSAYQSYSFFEGNKTTAGIDLQRLGGKALNVFPEDRARDSTQVDIHINNIAGYLNMQQTVLNNRLTLNAGIRLDHHEINGSEWIPQFGLSFTPTAYTSIKAIFSKGFRNPTIREMYMFPTRNPNLEAERLMNYEISLLQALPETGISLGVNLFYIKGDNIIQVQMVEGRPLNVNSGEIENKGFELTANYNASDNLRFSANYSLLNMTNKIIGAPEHKLYVNGNYTIDKWHFSTGLQYLGNLYTSVTPQPITENTWLWNARVNFAVLEWLNIFVRGENLLGQEYEINAGYPMPGATVFGGLRIDL